jgi:TldD protein
VDGLDVEAFRAPVTWLFFSSSAGMIRDVAYQSNTQECWNSCVATCDDRGFRLGGSFFDGKGQPGQVSAVSHGCSTTRFNGVNVINTERKI